jgi:dUTP pyrophosphatase
MKVVAKFEKVSREEYQKNFEVRPSERMNPEASVNQMYDHLVLPKRATKGSAGYDFFLPYSLSIRPHSEVKIPTGYKCKIEEGYVLQIYPRSSLGFKYRLHLDNTVGIIDSDYYNNEKNEGHIIIKLYNPSNKTVEIHAGEAYAQGIFGEFYLAEEEEVTAERKGGMGSTNK